MRQMLARIAAWRTRRNLIAAAFHYGRRRQILARRSQKWSALEHRLRVVSA